MNLKNRANQSRLIKLRREVTSGREYWLRRGPRRLLGDGHVLYLDPGGTYMVRNIFKNSLSCILKICALYVCYTSMRGRKERRKGRENRRKREREGSFPLPVLLPLFFPSFPGGEGEEGKERRENTPSQASEGQDGPWEQALGKVPDLTTLWI